MSVIGWVTKIYFLELLVFYVTKKYMVIFIRYLESIIHTSVYFRLDSREMYKIYYLFIIIIYLYD
jgi:hypothetical protein